MSGSEKYDLKSVKLPRLAGGQLATVANALDSGIFRAALLPSMLKSGGIEEFRSLTPDEPITVMPIAFVDKKA